MNRYLLMFICSFCLCIDAFAREDVPKFGVHKPSSNTETVVVVNWNSEEGRSRLAKSKYNTDFYQIAHFYSPQVYPTFCGIASSTIILNAMRVPNGTVPENLQLEMQLPKVWGGRTVPYHLYTQETFFTEATERVKTRAVISLKNMTKENQNDETAFNPGLDLKDLGGMLNAHGAVVSIIHAKNPNGTKSFRQNLIKHLSDPTHFILANFHGKDLGLNSGGHIVPLAAFDSQSDSVLLLDVAATKRPWIWVPVEEFYRAMHTLDGDAYRGYIIVSDLQ